MPNRAQLRRELGGAVLERDHGRADEAVTVLLLGRRIDAARARATATEKLLAEARQQLAMVQLRAVEHGTDALMVSTVGISAFVTADGDVTHATTFNTQAVRVRQLHLAGGETLATRLGEAPEWLAVGLAAVGLLWVAAQRRVAARAG